MPSRRRIPATPEQRKDNFDQVVAGYSVQQAMEDAQRCLECGCHDYFECKLVNYANQYDVKPDRLAGGREPGGLPRRAPLQRLAIQRVYPVWAVRAGVRRR